MNETFIHINEHISIEVKSPSILNLFPSQQYITSLHNNCRWLFQLLFGYKVFILLSDNNEIGYCAVSCGSSSRYPFASKNDIVIGPYYISPEYRGNSYGALLVGSCLENVSKLNRAFAFISPSNLASIRTVEKCGFVFDGDVSYSQVLRVLKRTQSGNMKLYCYEKKKDGDK